MSNNELIIKPLKPKGEDGHKYIAIRIRDDTIEKLDTACLKTGYNRNKLMNLFIEYGLSNYIVEETDDKLKSYS